MDMSTSRTESARLRRVLLPLVERKRVLTVRHGETVLTGVDAQAVAKDPDAVAEQGYRVTVRSWDTGHLHVIVRTVRDGGPGLTEVMHGDASSVEGWTHSETPIALSPERIA